jgi:hypothetical protein
VGAFERLPVGRANDGVRGEGRAPHVFEVRPNKRVSVGL